MALAIEVKNLSKSYGSHLALDNVSMAVPTGHLLGLLGPNGAGKTSLIKSILDLTHYSHGAIFISGKKSINPLSREGLGFLPEKFQFFPYYTVDATLNFFAKMQKINKQDLPQAKENALERLDILDLRTRRLKTLSKGQLQRVGLACLLVAKSNLLILDEPFSGLDPLGIREVKEILRDLKSQGKTIILSSHILSEVEQVCDSVLILNRGKVLASGPLETLRGDQNLEEVFFRSVTKAQNDERNDHKVSAAKL